MIITISLKYSTDGKNFKSEILKNIDFENNSDDFIFDNQMLLQILSHSYRIGEISCPCKYFAEASTINIRRSIVYGLGCVYWSIIFLLGRLKLYKHPLIFNNI